MRIDRPLLMCTQLLAQALFCIFEKMKSHQTVIALSRFEELWKPRNLFEDYSSSREILPVYGLLYTVHTFTAPVDRTSASAWLYCTNTHGTNARQK